MISLAGLKKSNVFPHAIHKQIFGGRVFFLLFLTKKEMRRVRRQSSVFLPERGQNFCYLIVSLVFAFLLVFDSLYLH